MLSRIRILDIRFCRHQQGHPPTRKRTPIRTLAASTDNVEALCSVVLKCDHGLPMRDFPKSSTDPLLSYMHGEGQARCWQI